MPIREYLAELRKNLAQKDATELTHRRALQNLLEALGEKEKIRTTNEASYKTEKVGRPDIRVYRERKGGGLFVGVVETKDIGADLDKAEKSEQLKRYLAAFPNLLLTDYVESRWYKNRKFEERAVLGECKNGKIATNAEGEARTEAALL